MSDNARIAALEKGISARLDGMTRRARGDLRAFLGRVTYPQYQKAQLKRWETENVSETGTWKELNEAYRQRKLIRFKDYPGAGTKKLIATDRLRKSVVGLSNEHRLMIEERTIAVSTAVPYAQYVSDVRDFSTFGKTTQKLMLSSIKNFITRGAK